MLKFIENLSKKKNVIQLIQIMNDLWKIYSNNMTIQLDRVDWTVTIRIDRMTFTDRSSNVH